MEEDFQLAAGSLISISLNTLLPSPCVMYSANDVFLIHNDPWGLQLISLEQINNSMPAAAHIHLCQILLTTTGAPTAS